METVIRPETEMKDSGVQWIGDIPNDWDVRRLKYVLNERKEKNDPLVTDNILSLSAEQGVIPFSERIGGGNKPKEDLTAYKVVRAGDIVLNSMNVLSGAVHYSNYTGCVSPVYYMLYNENDVITRYYNLVFQTEAFQRSLRGLGNGILIKETDEGKLNTIRMRIPMEKLNKVKLPSPSFDEMKKVVESIEPIRSKIDEIIAEAKASVDEYKELKQSVIFEAVTKGLDKNVEMKDSGVEWIGLCPKHWVVSRIKNECSNLDNLREPVSADNRENKLGLYDYYGASGVIDKIDYYNVDDVVLLIGEDGANLRMRNLPLVYRASGKFWVNNHAHILKINERNDYEYMAYMLEAGDYSDYITGSAQPKLSQFNLMRFPIVHPPLNEQIVISQYLVDRIPQIDSLISEKESLINDLEAYKKSLIYEVVTGKRRVV